MTRDYAMKAPTSELCDWLAVDDKWEPYTASNGITVWHRGEVAVNYEVSNHPYQPTRDGAAMAMPEGWEWRRWAGVWHGFPPSDPHMTLCRSCPDTGDEIADRYRLAVLCRLAWKEASK